ncbi:MAG: 2Fe-2S iron-sulfur cluster binding domain-containing protein, partial [Actinobacteria bacterium]|nr:2Fe-2S iron-sulfur cluster binding domain-containing protein [Actinomycetota bacterium]
MKNNIKIDIEPIGKRIFLDEPENALNAIREAGIGIKTVCAGKGTCGKCRIMLLDKSRNAPTEREQKVLTAGETEHGIRLACQQTFDKNTTIYIPASSLTEEQKLQVSGVETEFEPDPTCRKYYIELLRPTLSDVESDFTRIKKSLHDKYGLDIKTIDFKVLHEMPAVLRENSWKATVSVRSGEIILIEAGDKADRNFGAAIDLGTTKIAVLLVDLLSGKTIDKKGVMNPQISFGEDVMSRINFAMQSAENLQKIQSVVIEQINKTIGELADNNGLSASEILEIVLVGNTAMHHLFLGLPVKQLG